MSFLDLFRANTMPGQNAVAPIMQPNVAMFGSMAPPQPTNWMRPQQQQPGPSAPPPPIYFGTGMTDSPTAMAMGMGNNAVPFAPPPGMSGPSLSGMSMPTQAPQQPAPQPSLRSNAQVYSPRAQMPSGPPSAPSGQETPTNWMAGIAAALDTLPALGNPGASGGGAGGGIASMPGAVSSPGQGIGGGVPTNWMGGGLSNPLQPTNWKQPSLFGGK